MPKQKQQLDSTGFFIIVAGFLLIALAIFLVFSQNTATTQISPTLSEEEIDALVPRVSIDEAKSALDLGTAILLDVRSAEDYQMEHITGAINIPLAEIETRISELDPNQWIITYCT
ncbi:MAG: rhodanese-like domain-containing protein [Anaerolineales bacterium]|nr:rhodanese-like domain-containing protein [Anaerolineales bacterium]